jgi:hypothetical protein
MAPTLAHIHAPWLWSAPTWAGLTFLVLLAAAAVGWFQLEEARKLREASLRPFITIDFEVESPMFYVAVTNIGATLARDVTATFDPPLESAAIGEDAEFHPRFQELLAAGLPTLAPGKKIRTLLDVGPQRKASGLRDDYNVTVSYTADVTGKSYTEETRLDLGIYWSLVRITKHDLHDVHERLKEAVAELKKLAAGVRGLQP